MFDATIMPADVIIPGYTMTRKDRNVFGGGVAVWTKSELSVAHLQELENGTHEILWVPVALGHDRKMTLGAVYRPGTSAANDLSLVEHLDQNLDNIRSTGTNIVIAGDFNVHHAE